jgi:hypothetical protein
VRIGKAKKRPEEIHWCRTMQRRHGEFATAFDEPQRVVSMAEVSPRDDIMSPKAPSDSRFFFSSPYISIQLTHLHDSCGDYSNSCCHEHILTTADQRACKARKLERKIKANYRILTFET